NLAARLAGESMEVVAEQRGGVVERLDPKRVAGGAAQLVLEADAVIGRVNPCRAANRQHKVLKHEKAHAPMMPVDAGRRQGRIVAPAPRGARDGRPPGSRA